jgi:hypothetical protein
MRINCCNYFRVKGRCDLFEKVAGAAVLEEKRFQNSRTMRSYTNPKRAERVALWLSDSAHRIARYSHTN